VTPPADRLLLQRLVVAVGPGGVGKTSASAAMAIAAAAAGRRVALLTIDPARRLADALGLDELDDWMRPVPLRDAYTGSLHAAMLDTKRSFDALITRLADEPKAILDNRVYQAFSRTLARSHAYAAMERLYDLLHDDAYEMVVLDTPPLRSALDILDAPARLRAFLDETIVAAFFGPGLVGRGARGTSAIAGRLLSLVAGRKLVGEMLGFFEAFMPMREGFAARAAATGAALRANDTAFVLVTAPEAAHLSDAAYLRDGLLERALRPALTVFNRAFIPAPRGRPVTPPPGPAARLEALDQLVPPPGPERLAMRRTLDAIAAVRGELATTNERAHRAMASFVREGDPVVQLPRLEREPLAPEALLDLWRQARPL
jgi:anion-transporting  ArsA/GET3 family ATPase